MFPLSILVASPESTLHNLTVLSLLPDTFFLVEYWAKLCTIRKGIDYMTFTKLLNNLVTTQNGFA